MGAKTVNFLKNENRDFNNVLDSFLNNTDGGSLTGALHATNAINSIGNKKFMNFGASLAGINATAVTYGANDILVEEGHGYAYDGGNKEEARAKAAAILESKKG